ncbi:hypothetical protein BCR35DRAFT_222359 [Leucosporidium creatinivorum]|uniref:Uncharacterized protein n=1 Tax=Leucosporidium creatinivorum TaxID=106004 RepID=A0A1Y2D789_9BASI|nr:hypothetical protein BCR35DRAFT_222359 [Leucosporidium creatinivorum]
MRSWIPLLGARTTSQLLLTLCPALRRHILLIPSHVTQGRCRLNLFEYRRCTALKLKPPRRDSPLIIADNGHLLLPARRRQEKGLPQDHLYLQGCSSCRPRILNSDYSTRGETDCSKVHASTSHLLCIRCPSSRQRSHKRCFSFAGSVGSLG